MYVCMYVCCDFFYLISRQFELQSYEYMKIMYVNCRGKNYMKVDRRSYRRHFYSCEKKAWKKSGLYRISLNFFFATAKVASITAIIYFDIFIHII